ncbi:integrator complex assembly factor BRAT1 isoform X2 [Amia ocellicauda]|uniref:integrator complex assembly factor BRAT1 isoform X2 n=1 Tax=Amia ocellicauda TaxID=2972642 RepID=UPI003464D880
MGLPLLNGWIPVLCFRNRLTVTHWRTMDSQCAELLPLVCAVLSDPRQSLPDDTCLEKLLDWFTELTGRVSGLSLLQLHPCLTDFMSAVFKQKSSEPVILSFSLRLAGQLAASEEGFSFLEHRGVLDRAFGAQGVRGAAPWSEATVRSGWVRGLGGMLQHTPARHFFHNHGYTAVVLDLQTDMSLFVAAAANQLLAQILISTPSLPGHASPENGIGGVEDGTVEIVRHVGEALCSEDPLRSGQVLRLVGLTVGRCPQQVTEMLWQRMQAATERMMGNSQHSVQQPLLDALLAVARTALFSSADSSLVALMDGLLGTLSPKQAIPFASGIARLQDGPAALRRKATAVILQPLDCILAATDQQHPAGLVQEFVGERSVLEEQMSRKASCVSLLCLALSHTQQLSSLGLFPDPPATALLRCVLTVLKLSSGVAMPCGPAGASVLTSLIGSSRVQRSALDALGGPGPCPGGAEVPAEVLAVLLEYLRNPGVDSSVLKKAMQAVSRWLCFCSDSAAIWLFLNEDLIPVLKKRLCDVRWEVRDSALELLTQLAEQLREKPGFRTVLSGSGLPVLLLSSLSDPESYVRASAITALGQVALVSALAQELQDLALRFVEILAQDSEGFPRRAVIRVFSMWLTQCPPLPAQDLEAPTLAVLALGAKDLDWEVKVHTLELAETWMEQTLGDWGTSGPVEPLQKLLRWKLLDGVCEALDDCDRPVARKACSVLLALKGLLSRAAGLQGGMDSVTWDPAGQRWAEELRQRRGAGESGGAGPGWLRRGGVLEVLSVLELEALQETLGQSSDHVQNSPRSLLEDIAAARASEDNAVDCY